MQVTKNITLDLLETGSPVIIKAKQNDRNTRYIAAHLYVDGLAYPVPSGTEIAFRYKKPDGTAGFYDALPDNSPAITVSGNTVTVELVEQVLTAAGCVHCEINMYNAASEKLTTFTFEISVEESVLTDAEIISSDYYNVLTAEIAKALQAVTDATEQAENAAQSAQDAADSASMSKDWAAGQPVTYSGTPVSIAYAGAQRIASITAYGETPQGGTTEAPVALTGVDSAILFEQHTPINLAKPNEGESNGISIIANADGSVTARGTATKDTWPVLVRINIPSSIVSGDITISLSSPASVGMAFQSHSPSGKVENVYLSAGYTSVTTKIKSGYTGMHIFLSLLPDQTIDETFHIMIAQGIEPVPFVPYVEPSVTTLPIPRPLRRVGDVKDKCVTRVKSVYDKRIVLDGTENWKMGGAFGDGAPYIFCDLLNDHYQAFPIISSRIPSTNILTSNKNQGIGCWDRSLYLRYDSLFTNVEELKTYLSAHPLTVYYQSTAYDGTNGLDVCLMKYQTGYIESYADKSITTAWISSTGALSTGAEVAYVLSFPETYATDPVDFDNTAGPLTVMTGGELEVRMTELVGTRSDVSNNTVAFAEAAQDADIASGEKLSVLFGKIKKRFSVLASTVMQKSVFTQVGNPNLLDNSDFKNPVNQRGVSGTISTAGYFIDRWKLVSGTVQITAESLVLNGTISQILENAAGTDVTASASAGTASYDNSTKTFTLTGTGQTITWAKLEKGSVATPYVPKGYGAELSECLRYYYQVASVRTFGQQHTGAGTYANIILPQVMRVTPTVSAPGEWTIRFNGMDKKATVSSVNSLTGNTLNLTMSTIAGGTYIGPLYAFYDGKITFSADL